MKTFLARTTFALAVLLAVAFGLTLFAPNFVEAQAPYFYTLVVNGNLKIYKEISSTGSDNMFCASNAFTTTATLDTVAITGVTTADIFVVSIEAQAALDTVEVLSAIAGTDTLFVARSTTAVVPTSALGYNFIRINK